MRKTLPTNHDVIVEFLNQILQEERNPRDSLWFKGNKLYSYQSHLATIMPDRTLFINSEMIGYSTTTSAHITSLQSFAGNLQTFIIPLNLQSNEVLNWYWDNIENTIIKYLKARVNKEYYKRTILQTINSIEQYMDYMELSKDLPEYQRKHIIAQQLFKHKII